MDKKEEAVEPGSKLSTLLLYINYLEKSFMAATQTRKPKMELSAAWLERTEVVGTREGKEVQKSQKGPPKKKKSTDTKYPKSDLGLKFCVGAQRQGFYT